MRCHCPPTSFIGYLRRRAPPTSSRTEAPLAQCVPRLIGLSQDGSCPTQTPFTTSAVTVQPTEQCVQMFFLISGLSTIVPAAWALSTDPSWIDPMAARPPTVRPDCRRNVRRSMTPEARPAATACSLLRLASPLLRLVSMAQPSLLERLVAVGAVEGLDVIGLPIACLRLILARVVGLRLRRGERRGRRRDRGRAAHGAEEIAAVQRRAGLLGRHRLLRPGIRPCGLSWHIITRPSRRLRSPRP